MDPNTTNPSSSETATPAPEKPAMDAALNQEIDEAMAALGMGPGGEKADRGGKRDHKKPVTLPGHDVAPIGGPAKAALKGPRVVSAGRTRILRQP